MSQSNSLKKFLRKASTEATVGLALIAGVGALPQRAAAQVQQVQKGDEKLMVVNGKAMSGTVKVDGVSYTFFDNLAFRVIAKNGQPLSQQDQAPVDKIKERIDALLSGKDVNAPPSAEKTEVATAPAAAPAASTAEASVPMSKSEGGFEFLDGGTKNFNDNLHQTKVEFRGNVATIHIPNTLPYTLTFGSGGLTKGIKTFAAGQSGRQIAVDGGWAISMSGREIYNTARGGPVPGGNDGSIMQMLKVTLTAEKDAEAEAAKAGLSYTPPGKKALESFIEERDGGLHLGLK